jgi:hypothetical protein
MKRKAKGGVNEQRLRPLKNFIADRVERLKLVNGEEDLMVTNRTYDPVSLADKG